VEVTSSPFYHYYLQKYRVYCSHLTDITSFEGQKQEVENVIYDGSVTRRTENIYATADNNAENFEESKFYQQTYMEIVYLKKVPMFPLRSSP